MVYTRNSDWTNDFREDPTIITQSSQLEDYRGSGYVRGPLHPFANMHFSQKAISETFYLGNIDSIEPSFNRRIWKNVESLGRSWAVDNDNIYDITAAVLPDNLKTIGSNKVLVPQYYYKTILGTQVKRKKE